MTPVSSVGEAFVDLHLDVAAISREAAKAGALIERSMSDAAADSEKSLDKIGGADVWGDIERESARAGESIERSMAEAARESEGHLNRIGGIGRGIFGIVAGAAASIGVGALFKTAVDEASDFNESINAVNVTFKDAAAGVHQLADEASTSIGLTAGQFNSLAVQFGAFSKTIAGPGGDVTKTLDDMTTRAADFASVMNLEVADAAAIFQSGLAGETEPLRKFGIDLSAAKVEAFAYANGIAKTGEELTEAQKVQARYGALMEQTAQTQGDFANTSGELANGLRILKAQALETAAGFGSALLPGLKDVVGELNALIVDIAAPFAELGKSIAKALGPLMKALGPAITTVVKTLSVVLDDVSVVLGALAPLIEPIVKVVGVLAKALSGILAKAFTALTPVIELVASFIGELADVLGGAIMSAIEALTPAFNVIGQVLRDVLAVVLPILLDLFQRLSPILTVIANVLGQTLAIVLPVIADAFLAVVTAVEPLIPLLADSLMQIINALAPLLPQLAEAFGQIVQALLPLIPPLIEIVMALLPPLTELIVALVPVITTLATLLADGLAAVIELLVPLLVAMAEGIAFVAEWLGKLISFIAASVEPALDGLTEGVEGVTGAFTWLWENVLSPFVDFVGGAATTAFNAFKDNVLDPLKTIIDNVRDAFQEVWDVLEPLRSFLVGAFKTAWDWLTRAFEIAWGLAQNYIAILEKVWNVFSSVANIILGAFRSAWDWLAGAVQFVIGFVQSLIDKLERLWDLWNKGWDKVTFSKGIPFKDAPGIGRLIPGAMGGIYDRPTGMLIGEAGREALIPVTRPGRAMQLMEESGLGAMWERMRPGTGMAQLGGALVHIENATFQDATDADLVAQRTNAALDARLAA